MRKLALAALLLPCAAAAETVDDIVARATARLRNAEGSMRTNYEILSGLDGEPGSLDPDQLAAYAAGICGASSASSCAPCPHGEAKCRFVVSMGEAARSAAHARAELAVAGRTAELVLALRPAADRLGRAGCSEGVDLDVSNSATPALVLSCEAPEETGRGSRSMSRRDQLVTADALEPFGFGFLWTPEGRPSLRDLRTDTWVDAAQFRTAVDAVRPVILGL